MKIVWQLLARDFHSSKAFLSKQNITKSLFDVNCMLQANEYTREFVEGSVKSYDSNQVASNNPIEDARTEGY